MTTRIGWSTPSGGDLNANHDAITDKAIEQDWGLDPTGNWETFDFDDDGDDTWELEQTRSHNAVNETGTIGATTGTNWADPSHDRAGNMTTLPKPSDLGNSIGGEYDAWNRLVEVTDGGVRVAKFRYDGEGRRIVPPIRQSFRTCETHRRRKNLAWRSFPRVWV